VRELQVVTYNNQVDNNKTKLENSYQTAIKDFDILRDADPAIQKELDDALDAFEAKHVSIDAYGNPIEVSGDLYTFLKNKADSIERLTRKGAAQQVKSKGKEKSKVFTPQLVHPSKRSPIPC
jgi:hypothetical protein